MGKQKRLPFPPKSRRSYVHFVDRVFGTPLAIEPRKLATILHAIGPRLLGVDQITLNMDALDGDPTPAERDSLRVVDGIAIIDVMGSLVHRGGFMDALSGLTSYEDVRGELNTALADPRVSGILLRIDSPGGEVSGAFDLADAIYAARDVKPICAVAEDMACSAAYAIGSAASMLYAAQAAVVGSIGVVLARVDETKANEQAGIKVTPFYAGARKVDYSPDVPLSDDAAAAIQSEIDATYEIFVQAVARNRGLDPQAVRDTQAGIFTGAAAKAAGLVDEIGTSDAALAWLKGLADEDSTRAAPMPMRAPLFPQTADTASGATAEITTEPEEENDMELKEALAALEAAQKQAAALTAENEKNAAIAASAKAALEQIEADRKAEVIEKHMKRGAVVPAMKESVSKLAAACKDAKELDTMLAGFPVLLHLDRVGATADPKAIEASAQAETPYAKLKAIAAKKQAENPKLSAFAAFEAACAENPALYRDHRAAHCAANTRQ